MKTRQFKLGVTTKQTPSLFVLSHSSSLFFHTFNVYFFTKLTAVVIFLILPLFFVIFLMKNSYAEKTFNNTMDIDDFRVERIVFEGNDKTKPIILLNEIMFKENDKISFEDVEKSRQAIQNLSLFRRVEAYIDEGSDGKIITFKVKERHYWLILPDAARSSDGDISYGGDIEFTNLFGLNQQLEIEFEKINYDEGERDDEEKLTFDYEYPKLFGTDYSFALKGGITSLELDEERINDDNATISGQYSRDYDYLGFDVSKLLFRDRFAQGLNLSAGLIWENYNHDYISGSADLFDDADIIKLNLGASLSDIDDFIYYREGKRYGYDLAISTNKLGSDKSFTVHELFYQRYKSLNPEKVTNFNYQLKFGFANSTAFGDDAFDIGGGRLIRGFSRDKLEGNTYWLVNTEYLTQIFGERTLRGVLFADIGNITEEPDDGLFSSAYGDVGMGIRWKLNFLVKTDLRLDAAFGIGSDADNRFYIGTRSTF